MAFAHLLPFNFLCQEIDANAVPLQSLGVVDVVATDINNNEILAHALANVSQSEKGAVFT